VKCRLGSVARSCGHGNETSESKDDGESPEQMNNIRSSRMTVFREVRWLEHLVIHGVYLFGFVSAQT
jgi:hypothetical protein